MKKASSSSSSFKFRFPEANQLSGFLSEKPKQLYPFEITDTTPSADVKKRFQEAGILDQKGHLNDAAGRGLAIISQAASSARLRFMVEGDLLEYHVFFGPGDGISASLRKTATEIVLETPAPTDSLLEVLTDFIGTGFAGVVPSLGDLPIPEALCGLAIIDLTRREFFQSLADDSTWKPKFVTPQAIQKIITREDLNSGWLVWLLKSLLRSEPSLDQTTISSALSELAKRGFLEKKDGGFIPANQFLIMSRRLLMLNNLFRIDAVRLLNDRRILRQTFGMVQNGTRDILYMEATDLSVVLSGLSGKTLFGLLHRYLTDPLAIHTDQSELSCIACGKPIEQDAPFCKFCGTAQKATEDKPRFCSKCGKELKPGKSFCSGCGYQMSSTP